jgi:hypothetical protein
MISDYLESTYRFESEKSTDIILFFISQIFENQSETKLFTFNSRDDKE